MHNLGIVGVGFMGSAVVRGILRKHPEVQFGMVEKDGGRRDYATRELGALDFTAHPEELFGYAEMVVLAIKPQDLAAFAKSTGPVSTNKVILTMLAGTSISAVQTAFGTPQVIRIMPNLAADIGKAVTGITFSEAVPHEIRPRILALLSGLGTLIEVREELLHAITGISGSGIAFVLEFIHALAQGGVEQGLPFSDALVAARDVVESAAQLMREGDVHPAEMVSQICSPGGTTIAGIRALHDNGFQSAVMAAVEAATMRSRELGSR